MLLMLTKSGIRAKFGTTLEVIQSTNATARDIVDAAQVESPLEWISLIILLDQLPRNCNRGLKAHVAYRFFDPLALEVAMQAITDGIPELPEVKYRHAYRMWFYLPLEHSESMGILIIVLQEHDKMFRESRELMGKCLDPNDINTQWRSDLIWREHAFELWEKTLRAIVREHVQTVQLHGRYPHRDLALAR